MERWYHKIMHPLNYLHLQMRLEGKQIFNECLIRQVEVVPGEGVPLMLIAQLASEERIVYYDESLSSELLKELAATIISIEFPAIYPVFAVLKKQKLQFDVGHYKTYVFPSILVKNMDVQCFSKDNEKVKAFGFDGFAEQVYVIEREGNVVSACVSTRENDKCGEAWVYTAPEYRNQGFAQNVVNTWAGSLMNVGKTPFYSHKIDNVASANLARRLKLQPVFEEISITRA